MIAAILSQLDLQDVLDLGGLPSGLYQGDGIGPAEKWLETLAEVLAGTRTWESLVQSKLDSGRRWDAFHLAAKTRLSGWETPAALEASLILSWSAIREEYATIIARTHEDLAAVGHLDTDIALLAEMYRETLAGLPQVLPEQRPESASALLAAQDLMQRALAVSHDAGDVRREDEREQEAREHMVFGLATRAFERLLAALRTGGSEDAHLREHFRGLPDLILNRQHAVIEQLADPSVALERVPAARSAPQPAVVVGTHAVHDKPSKRPRRLVGTELPAAEVGSSRLALSRYAQAEVENAPADRSAITTADDLEALRKKARRIWQTGDRAREWLGAAKATPPGALHQIALSIGLFEQGRHLLDVKSYQPAMSCLRDSVKCFGSTAELAPEDFDRAVTALVAAKAWTQYRQGAKGRAEPEIQTWLEEPSRVFAWLARNDQLAVAVREWADLSDDGVARQFLAVLQVHVANDAELFRACAGELLQASRLLRHGERVVTRLKWLLDAARPSKRCLSLLDQLAEAFAEFASKPSSGATHRVGTVGGELGKELQSLTRDTVSPVGQVVEDLGQLLEATSKHTRSDEPRFTVRAHISTLYPEERHEEVVLPFLVTNHSGTAASDVTLQLYTDDKLPAGQRPTFAESSLMLGDFDPDASREARVVVELRPDLAHLISECTVFTQVKARDRAARTEHAHVLAVRPGNRAVKYDSPYSTGLAVKGEHFHGREEQMQRLLSAVSGRSQNRSVLLYGIRRIGKTSILYQAMNHDEVKHAYYPLYWSCEDRPSSETTCTYLFALCDKIREVIPEKYARMIALRRDDFKSDPYLAFERFLHALEQAHMPKRVLLFLDEVDKLLALAAQTLARQEREGRPIEAHEGLQPEVFGALRKSLMERDVLNIVFAGLPSILNLGYEHRLFGLLELIEVGPFSDREAKLVIEEGRKAFEMSVPARDRLFEASGLLPYYLELICHELFTRMVHSGRDMVAPLDVDDVIQEQLLPNETYFVDLVSLLGEERPILWGLAQAMRGRPAERKYVSVREVVDTLARRGYDYEDEHVHRVLESLIAGSGREEQRTHRPLVARALNKTNRFKLAIGLLGDYLIAHGG